MLIYNFILLSIACFSTIDLLRKKKSLIPALLIIISLIIVAALRGNGGSDFVVYEKYFLSLPEEIHNYGYGYFLLNNVTAYFGNYHLLIIVTSVLSISLQSLYLYKETSHPSIALLILFSSSFLLLNFILIRQAIAVGFILISFIFYKKNKLPAAASFSILAVLFHETAIFVLFLFILIETTPKITSYLLVITLIIAIPFLSDIALLVNELTINNKNLLIYINEKSLPSAANLVEVMFATICYMMLKKKKKFTTEIECRAYYSIMVSSIIIIILSYSIQPLARFLEYYRIIYIVLYIKFLESLNNKNKLIFFVILSLYCTARLNSFIYQYDNGFEYIFHGI